MARHDILDGGRSAAVRHKSKSCTGDLLKLKSGNMAAAPKRARQCSRRLVRVRLQPSDQIDEVGGAYRASANKQLRRTCQQSDRLEIAQDVKLDGKECGTRNVARPVTDDCHVAVGRRTQDTASTNCSTSPADVLDNDGVAQRSLHAL